MKKKNQLQNSDCCSIRNLLSFYQSMPKHSVDFSSMWTILASIGCSCSNLFYLLESFSLSLNQYAWSGITKSDYTIGKYILHQRPVNNKAAPMLYLTEGI